jgi:hypothetical protein
MQIVRLAMAKFKKGDRVKRKNTNTNQEESGTVQDINAKYFFWGADEDYVILWDNGTTEVIFAPFGDMYLDFEGENFEQLNLFNLDGYNLPTGINNVIKKCNHKWKTYVGFTEQYEYCELCNEIKKSVDFKI